jgi:hypothetical protein
MDYRDMSKLTVHNGRLINDRPDSVTGIQQAVSLKKELKQSRKIGMITSAIMNADMMKNIMK